MQAVSQSYSSQTYASIQNGLPFYGERPSFNQNSSSEQSPYNKNSEENVSISADAMQLSHNNETSSVSGNNESTKSENEKHSNQKEFTQEELKLITELQIRDKEVRTHEQAHLAAAGQYAAGGASFSFTTGPDGKRYANSGSVPIDLSKEKTPEATIQKMRTVQRSALAPASPSGADRNIAAQASAKETQAMQEKQTEAQTTSSDAFTDNDGATDPARNQRTETAETEQTNNQPPLPKVSDFSRQAMTSAYQSIAALAT